MSGLLWEIRKLKLYGNDARPGPQSDSWGGIGVRMVRIMARQVAKLSHSSYVHVIGAYTCIHTSVGQ